MSKTSIAPPYGGGAQASLWSLIDNWAEQPGWLCRGQIAAALGVSEAILSMWATGTRPMPVARLVDLGRLFRSRGEHHRTVELVRAIALRLDVHVGGAVTRLQGDLEELVRDVDEAAGEATRMHRRAMRDGEIDDDERRDLRNRLAEVIVRATAAMVELDGGAA